MKKYFYAKDPYGLAGFSSHFSNNKFLKKNEEYVLISKWQNEKDKKSLNKLLVAYHKLVKSIARKYLSYGVPNEDLIQEGIIGLIYAIEKFDVSKGFRLSTYSRWWIQALIQNYILKNWSIVKNGTTSAHKKLFFSLNKIKKQINCNTINFLEEESLKKVSKILNIKPLEIQNIESKMALGDQSLNQKVFEDNDAVDFLSLLEDDSPTIDNVVEKENDDKLKNLWLRQAIDLLKDREKIIISNRKLEEKAKTFEELGKKLKISKERVRQIEVQALKKLKINILEISKQPKNFFIN